MAGSAEEKDPEIRFGNPAVFRRGVNAGAFGPEGFREVPKH